MTFTYIRKNQRIIELLSLEPLVKWLLSRSQLRIISHLSRSHHVQNQLCYRLRCLVGEATYTAARVFARCDESVHLHVEKKLVVYPYLHVNKSVSAEGIGRCRCSGLTGLGNNESS